MSMKEDDTSEEEVIDRRVEFSVQTASPEDDWEEDPDDITRRLAMLAMHASNEREQAKKRFRVVLLVASLILLYAWFK